MKSSVFAQRFSKYFIKVIVFYFNLKSSKKSYKLNQSSLLYNKETGSFCFFSNAKKPLKLIIISGKILYKLILVTNDYFPMKLGLICYGYDS